MQEILLWAALLHEVGIVINHKNMQKHSAYILSNMELPGFDKEQQRLLATLVRLQINAFQLDDISQFARYTPQDVLTLVRLLRLAILLNRSRQATEQTDNIALKTHRIIWQLQFEKGYLPHNPLLLNDLKNEQKMLIEIGLELDWE